MKRFAVVDGLLAALSSIFILSVVWIGGSWVTVVEAGGGWGTFCSPPMICPPVSGACTCVIPLGLTGLCNSSKSWAWCTASGGCSGTSFGPPWACTSSINVC